jgi:hypothetical protein
MNRPMTTTAVDNGDLRRRVAAAPEAQGGGGALYGEVLKKDLRDENFRTISLQILGESTKPGPDRPTTYGDVSYTPESAPDLD